MKTALASDLHLEFGSITLKNTEGAKVLMLSGDILIAEYLHRNVDLVEPTSDREMKMLGSTQYDTIRYRRFLENVSQEFEYVIYVAGNHEFYHGKFPDAIDWMRTECARYPNIYFLEMNTLDIEDFTFVGGTLWTDFNKQDPITMSVIDQRLNDYRKIRYSPQSYRKLLPADILRQHLKTLDYFKTTLDADPSKKFVVMSHQAPAFQSIDPYHKDDFYMNGAYHTELSEFILERPQIKVWTHGHIHCEQDYFIGGTRVLCNPRGYIGLEQRSLDFKLKFFDI